MSADDVKRRAEAATARFQARVAQVQGEVEAFQSSKDRYTARPEHGAAGDPDEAAAHLRQLRDHLDHDLDVLQSRLPPTDTLFAGAKTYGGAVVAVGATLGAGVLTVSRRRRQRAEQRAVEAEAEVLATALLRQLGAAALTTAAGAEHAAGDAPAVDEPGSGAATDDAEVVLLAAVEDAEASRRWWLVLLGAVAFGAAWWLRLRGGPQGADLWGPPTEG